jgi:hypothetical protein
LTTRKPAGASLDAWLDQHTARAPGALRRRVIDYAGAAPPATTIADTLARAAGNALRHVLAAAGDRSVALDLLAADALVTLALLAQAEHAPAELGRFAAGILLAPRPGS